MWAVVFLYSIQAYATISFVVGIVLLSRWCGVPEIGGILIALAAGFGFELLKVKAYETAFEYER